MVAGKLMHQKMESLACAMISQPQKTLAKQHRGIDGQADKNVLPNSSSKLNPTMCPQNLHL